MADNVWKTVAVLLAIVVIRWLFSRFALHKFDDVSKRYIAKKTFGYLVGFIAFIFLVKIWVGGATGLAAYLGILSAGLAIALQDPLTNLAGWIFIAMRKPFTVGDRIQIGDHAGDVIDIRLFQFSLIEIGNRINAEQSTGRIIHIPNGWIFKQAQANYTEGFNFIWMELPITVTFESNWARAKEILGELGRKHSAIGSDHAAQQVRRAARKYLIFFQHLTPIVWTTVDDHGVTLTVRCLVDPRKQRSMQSALWEDVLTGFAEAGDIELAYPTTRFYDYSREHGSPSPGGRPG